MDRSAGERGGILLAVALLLIAGIGVAFAFERTIAAASARRERATERALAEARDALIAYAADRPISREVGPGYLPCPDLDGDGWAEATCGSQNGDTGQAERLGLLPWKTLGLPELRDGSGERLWYAVSSKHKGLLNCAVSRACLDMSPDAALGTITVRDASGALIHDGTVGDPRRADAGGAVAVVIAPGPPIARIEADGRETEQRRECAAGDCDAAGRCLTDPPQRAAACNPRNYLDRAPGAGEDNASFRDRNDAAGRALNGDGFIAGPVPFGDGRVAVNDRIAVVAYRDVMPRVMRRVALEVRQCLRTRAIASGGRYAWPSPPCDRGVPAEAAWREAAGTYFGHVAETPFDAICNVPDAVDRTWWAPWRAYVFYALARDYAPDAPPSPDCSRPAACVEMRDRSGRVVAASRALGILVAGNARLEPASACLARPACADDATCDRIIVGATTADRGDVVITEP